MAYIGIQSQQSRNTIWSAVLLITFPILLLAIVYFFIYFGLTASYPKNRLNEVGIASYHYWLHALPWVLLFVVVWFTISYFFNVLIIKRSVSAKSLERKDDARVYNLVENLCMSQGMHMVKINIIETPALNAFTTGINEKTYTITFTRGIIDQLEDAELEAVIGHELSHIKNKDVRLMIIMIVFVGLFTFIANLSISLLTSSLWSKRKKSNNNNSDEDSIVALALIAVIISLLARLFSLLLQFSVSRKREYLADAGSAQMTKNPLALASALEKISVYPKVESIKRDNIAQLCICCPRKRGLFAFISNLFSTHPPIEKRIKILEQF